MQGPPALGFKQREACFKGGDFGFLLGQLKRGGHAGALALPYKFKCVARRVQGSPGDRETGVQGGEFEIGAHAGCGQAQCKRLPVEFTCPQVCRGRVRLAAVDAEQVRFEGCGQPYLEAIGGGARSIRGAGTFAATGLGIS